MTQKQKDVLIYLVFFIGIIIWGFLSSYSKAGPKNQKVDLSQYFENNGVKIENQKLVIYTWATWCGVCKVNEPFTSWNYKIANILGIAFYSIEEGEDPEKTKEYVQSKKLAYPVLLGKPEILQKLNIHGYPSTIFFDRDGYKVFHDEGLLNPFSFFVRLIFL